MTKEELKGKIAGDFEVAKRRKGSVDKEAVKNYILAWLSENYETDERFDGFDKFTEMSDVLTLTEQIDKAEEEQSISSDVGMSDSVDAFVYALAVIDCNKRKLDIFKVKEDFGIDALYKKYNIKKENNHG